MQRSFRQRPESEIEEWDEEAMYYDDHSSSLDGSDSSHTVSVQHEKPLAAKIARKDNAKALPKLEIMMSQSVDQDITQADQVILSPGIWRFGPRTPTEAYMWRSKTSVTVGSVEKKRKEKMEARPK